VSKIKRHRDTIELHVVHPVYKLRRKRLPDGNIVEEEIKVKEMSIRKWVPPDAIISVEEFVNNRNEVVKNKSIIYNRYEGKYFVVKHSTDEVRNATHNHNVNPVGFVSNGRNI